MIGGDYATIGGGCQNSASGHRSGILGGFGNCTSHGCSMIVGVDITTQGNCTTHVNNLNFYAYDNNATTLGTAEASGEVLYYGTGTVSVGKVYQLEQYQTSHFWDEAHADNTADSIGFLALALGSGTAHDVGMLVRGVARFTSVFSSLPVSGKPLYLSAATEGLIVAAAPSSTGDVVRVVGHVLNQSDEVIYFNPDNTWVEL